jgi:hypothetical protein
MMDLWCRSTAADIKNESFFVSHNGYRIRCPAPNTGYQPTLKIVFVVVNASITDHRGEFLMKETWQLVF